MNLVDLQDFISNQGVYSLPFTLTPAENWDDFIFVNDKIAYKVENITNQYDASASIIVKDPIGNDIGVLLFTNGREYQISALTEYELVAALDNIESATDFLNPSIKFNCNYVVIDRNYFLSYETEYRTSSPLWGKFNHKYTGVTASSTILSSPLFITADNHSNFNQIPYFETAIRAISQVYPFERYLKYYHLLEMNFEYDVIRRIKELDVNAEAHKIGRLLEEYEKKEFNRIAFLFENYVTDLVPLINALNRIVPFFSIAENLLFIYARKDNNPFEDIGKFQQFVAAGDFSFATYRLVLGRPNTPQVIQQHNAFIRKLVAFVIYRIRNSIAHSKIGEYNMTEIDKSFLIEFGEPLLIEVLKQLFK